MCTSVVTIALCECGVDLCLLCQLHFIYSISLHASIFDIQLFIYFVPISDEKMKKDFVFKTLCVFVCLCVCVCTKSKSCKDFDMKRLIGKQLNCTFFALSPPSFFHIIFFLLIPHLKHPKEWNATMIKLNENCICSAALTYQWVYGMQTVRIAFIISQKSIFILSFCCLARLSMNFFE